MFLISLHYYLFLFVGKAEEPDEYPPFKDVFAEVNNHFNDLSEPIITAEVGCLLRKTMALFLLPPTLMSDINTSNSTAHSAYFTPNSSIFHHDANKKTFDSLLLSFKSQMFSSTASARDG